MANVAQSQMAKPSSILASEPYRIFFPVALVVGVLGVLLWPAFYAGWLGYYPNMAHARVMVEGFVGGFAVGFLGTAMPKMLATSSFRLWQVLVLLLLYVGYCVAHLSGYLRLGDGFFAVTVVMLVVCLAARVMRRGSLPPPGMVLALMGLVAGVGGALWTAFVAGGGGISAYFFAQRLLYQAFILLPILGVGSFIFPMILGYKNKQSPGVGKRWRNKALEAVLVGVLIIATYWVEVRGAQSEMSAARALLCFVWLTKESGWLARTGTRGVMAVSLRLGILCLLGGMVATALMQQQKIALEHTLYIGGFGLITMMVATRVIYGHSGQGQQFQKWIKPLVVLVVLLLLTMATRVSADFMPRVRISHHVYAAILWVLVSIIWGIAVVPSVRRRAFPVFKKEPSKKPTLMNVNFRK